MKTINSFPNYTVDYEGVVKSKITGKKKATRLAGIGYEVTDIYHKGIQKTSYIHRLVAEHFIDNPRGLNEVNHIDGNKLNNYVSNLEWVTHKENCIHKNKTGLGDRGVIKSHNTSGYVGVSKEGLRWRSYIVVDGKMKHLGRYSDVIDAAIAYDTASLKYHGDSGKRNFNDK